MSNSRYLRSRLFILIGVFAFLFGLAMLHPYPRQSLFGPKIRGEPWCVWGGAGSIGANAFDAISLIDPNRHEQLKLEGKIE